MFLKLSPYILGLHWGYDIMDQGLFGLDGDWLHIVGGLLIGFNHWGDSISFLNRFDYDSIASCYNGNIQVNGVIIICWLCIG
jgi:hypothetical protein